MFKGVWQGNDIPANNRILILGESHYGDVIIDKDMLTKDVVNRYLNDIQYGTRKKWAQFFDKIAFSFGYEKEQVEDFYSKVFFGNYIEAFCGIKDGRAKDILAKKENRGQYNDSLFEFVNEHHISTIICFSILAYNHLPGASADEKEEKTVVGPIGSKKDMVRVFTYQPSIEHPHCNIILENELQVIGVRHPSSASGYSSENVYGFLKKMDGLQWLIQGD
ncbi:MAG: hypothetical protein SOW12_08265 [Lachnospiraceae bacterium]|nr:hypothetical protein [Lachnoclostridium sp.]MDY2599907.1 hypothetical protein [Lachnospiraceae bacterium]MDY5728546.1 hypothetical protein [Erysipelotrichaceae bacterium]